MKKIIFSYFAFSIFTLISFISSADIRKGSLAAFSIGKSKQNLLCEVQWLESTGTQYIDTGIMYLANTYYLSQRIVFEPLNYRQYDPGTLAICGISNYGTRIFGINFTSTNNRGVTLHYGNSYHYSNLIELKKYDVTVSGNGTCYIDGNLITISPNNVQRNGNIYVFAVNAVDSSGVSHIYPRAVKVYEFALTDIRTGEELIHLHPVRIGNVGYMYDSVSQTIYETKGTGNFIAGPDKR